jgi:hypothetical protein
MNARMLLCLALAACGGASQTPIPVEGSDENVSQMAGKWEGSYPGLESGRQGTVSFDLTLGHHAAEGQVIMFPQGASGPGQPSIGQALKQLQPETPPTTTTTTTTTVTTP